AENYAKLRAILPDDPWTHQVQMLGSAATVERIKAEIGEGAASPEQLAALAEAEGVLKGERAAFAGRNTQGPMRRRVIEAIIDLYGPKMLNKPDRAGAAKRHLKDATS